MREVSEVGLPPDGGSQAAARPVPGSAINGLMHRSNVMLPLRSRLFFFATLCCCNRAQPFASINRPSSGDPATDMSGPFDCVRMGHNVPFVPAQPAGNDQSRVGSGALLQSDQGQ
jgi:hypothetical protein